VTGGDASQLGDASASGPLGLAKLAVVVVAVSLAYRSRVAEKIPSPIWALLGFAAAATVGALVASEPQGALRGVRVAVVVLAVTWAVSRTGLIAALRCVAILAVGMVLASLLALLVGLQPLVGDGRLAGYLPGLQPNALAIVAVGGLLALLAMWTQRELRTLWLLFGVALLGLGLSLTGSRTALGALAAGVVVLLIRSITKGFWRACLLGYSIVLTGLLALWVEWNSRFSILSTVLARAGEVGLDPTLTGRTYAWDVAAGLNRTLVERLFGQGLQLKVVLVPRGNIDVYQGIDSTWWAAYLGAGLIGAVLLALAVTLGIFTTFRAQGVGTFAIIVAMTAGSFTESSLADVSFGLTLFVVAAAAPQLQRLSIPVGSSQTGLRNKRERFVVDRNSGHRAQS
jgi:O-antigen ligase